MPLRTHGLVFIGMLIVLVLNSVSQGVNDVFRGTLVLNNTEFRLENSTGNITDESLKTYTREHPAIYLGFWATCWAGSCHSTAVHGCKPINKTDTNPKMGNSTETKANDTVTINDRYSITIISNYTGVINVNMTSPSSSYLLNDTVAYYKIEYFNQSEEICREYTASHRVMLASLLFIILTAIASCFPGTFWGTLFFSVIAAVLHLICIILLVLIKNNFKNIGETVKEIYDSPSNTENSLYNIEYDFSSSFWVLISAFIVSVLVPIIIIIKKEEQRPICTDEESAEAHADEDSHPTDEATSLIPHADHETPTPSSSRPVDSTGIAPSSGGVMFANPTYYSVASGSGTGT